MRLTTIKIIGIIIVGILAFYFRPTEPKPQTPIQNEIPVSIIEPMPLEPPPKPEIPTVISAKTQRAMKLAALATDLKPEILELALSAHEAAKTKGLVSKPLLTVIDYTKPSVEKRLWVFDLTENQLILETHVSHGEGSGGEGRGNDLPNRFSNNFDSRQTSIGVFTTGETYSGMYGHSLRLVGREKGINDNARKRAIIIHGAQWASEDYIEDHGSLGTSWGCPAVSEDIAEELIELIKGGSLIFAYYPDKRWLKNSRFLKN